MQSKRKGSALIGLMVVVLIVALTFFLLYSKPRTGQQGENSYLQAIGKAKRVADQNKVRVLNTEITRFKIEEGRLPKNLQELVKNGYTSPKAIVDSYGKPLGYKEGKVWLEKQAPAQICGKCKNKAPGNAKPGDKCPHCGAIWK